MRDETHWQGCILLLGHLSKAWWSTATFAFLLSNFTCKLIWQLFAGYTEGFWHLKCIRQRGGLSSEGSNTLPTTAQKQVQQKFILYWRRNSRYQNFSFILAKMFSVVLLSHFHIIGFTVIVPEAAVDANPPMPEVASQDRKLAFLLFKTPCDLF